MTEVMDDLAWVFTEGAAYADDAAWHATAARLRRESPIVKVEREGWPTVWAVMKHADIMTIERRHDIFVNTSQVQYYPLATHKALVDSGAEPRTLIHMDDPEHKAFRGLTTEYFTAGTLRRNLQQQLQDLSTLYVDKMVAAGGSCDFAAEIANHYPLQVILTMLGVPEEDHPRVLRMTQEAFGSNDPEYAASLPGDFSYAEASTRMLTFLSAMTDARREKPNGDLASTIANSIVNGKIIGDLEAMNYYAIMASAGHDTTSSTMSAGLEALLDNPDALRELQADPSLIKNAVDEMLRWASPAKGFTRQATEDFEIRDVVIRAGDRVLLSWPSANRDEDVFTDSFTFDIHRPNANRHIAFGFGKHFCLGAELARMELRTFFAELLGRLNTIEQSGPVTRMHSNLVSGVTHLPVTYSWRT